MAIGTTAVGAPLRLTGSAVVAGGTAMARVGSAAENTALQGAIRGWFVSNNTSGTLALSTNNAGAAGTAITGTITYTTGGNGWYEFPCVSASGIFATIGGALDVTFLVVE